MAGLNLVMIPEMFWDYCHSEVIVMERMNGVPISQTDRLRAAGVDMKKLARDGVTIFFTQVFRDGFFHADQHPGNLWIKPDGTRIYLDFGIMGELSTQDRTTLLKILFALYTNNIKKVISLITEAGWLTLITNSTEIEQALQTVSQTIVNRRQQDFSLGKVVTDLFRSLESFDVAVPYQFTLLAKTILVVEGVSKQIAPNLNIQSLAGPVLLKHFAETRKINK